MANERLFEEMTNAVIAGLPDKAQELANEVLRAGIDPLAAIEQGFKPGMDVVGEGFAKGELFIPDLMMSSKAMQEGIAVLADLFDANLTALGREVQLPPPSERMGSTDMGNVSHVVPALHPYVAIAPEEVAGHSPEFRAAAASPEGHAGLLDAAKALAMTAIDLFSNPELVDAAWEEHRTRFG